MRKQMPTARKSTPEIKDLRLVGAIMLEYNTQNEKTFYDRAA